MLFESLLQYIISGPQFFAMSRSLYNFPVCHIFSTKHRNLNSTGLGWLQMIQHSRQVLCVSVLCFHVCKDDTRITRRLHKPDLFRVLRKKKILKLMCHTQFFVVLLTLCETSEMFFLTLQKNNKYLSFNVSL
jgi:hypothetical protein